jgi:hypothetical protein
VYGEQLAPVYPHTGGLARHLLTLLTIHILHLIRTSTADPDPMIFFFTPGSGFGMGKNLNPGSGMKISYHISEMRCG